MIETYANLGSPWCCERLIHNILNEQNVDAMKQCYVRIGGKGNANLLKSLELEWSRDVPVLVKFKKRILVILSETGDESCIAAIEAVGKQHAPLRTDSIQTIKSIRERLGG